MIFDQCMLQHQRYAQKETQSILYVQVCQVLERVKFEHNKLCHEPENQGSDTNCNTPKQNNMFGGVTMRQNNKQRQKKYGNKT
jgi:hypothetical protein